MRLLAPDVSPDAVRLIGRGEAAHLRPQLRYPCLELREYPLARRSPSMRL